MHRADAPTGGSANIKEDAVLHITNSILDDNDGDSAWTTEDNGEIHFSYSNLSGNDGGFDGDGVSDPVGTNGNISEPSGFVDAANLDYSLASGSACIDAADPELDDPDGSRADMGAYGGPNAN